MSSALPSIVVTDTSVLVNFLRIDRMDLVAANSFDFLVTDHVSDEITDTYPDQLTRFQAALSQGILSQVSLTDPQELALFGALSASGRLGLGECSAIALAVHEDHMLAIDDRRAAAEARRTHAQLQIVKTQDLVLTMIQEGLLTVVQADAILNDWAQNHRFTLRIGSFAELLP